MHRNSAMEGDWEGGEQPEGRKLWVQGTSVPFAASQPTTAAAQLPVADHPLPPSIAEIKRITGALLLEALVSDLDPGSPARKILELRSSTLDVIRRGVASAGRGGTLGKSASGR